MAHISMYPPPPSRCRSNGLRKSSFRCRTLVFGSGVGVAVLGSWGSGMSFGGPAAISTPLPKHALT